MKQFVTKGIVLSRTDFGEADRILTLLTPDYGKLRLMAKGVRRVKSKLAGGIELFSVSDITFIRGRGDIGTLVSSRLQKYYGEIVKNIDRTMLGYELIKMLNKVTEDEPEPEYFELLEQTFVALDNSGIDLDLIKLWFSMQLLRLGGHRPNLQTDTAGQKLKPDEAYNFDFDKMAFAPDANGNFQADHIKFLRLGFSGNQPKILNQVQGSAKLTADCLPPVQTMLAAHLRI
ncbi:MAG TPA: DNA repair protein RecO [Candidatus Saccharimonadales bacterium]|jgi:DNA repair protein RecO (recombination protein O)